MQAASVKSLQRFNVINFVTDACSQLSSSRLSVLRFDNRGQIPANPGGRGANDRALAMARLKSDVIKVLGTPAASGCALTLRVIPSPILPYLFATLWIFRLPVMIMT
jgi:hypothetical protein